MLTALGRSKRCTAPLQNPVSKTFCCLRRKILTSYCFCIWWNFKDFLCSPRKLGEDGPALTSIFFQMGLGTNHQLERIFEGAKKRKKARPLVKKSPLPLGLGARRDIASQLMKEVLRSEPAWRQEIVNLHPPKVPPSQK